jgi:flavodoxin I
MKALIVFDTVQGNTEIMARAMAVALTSVDVKVIRPGEVNPQDLKTIDLLVVGSPTMGGRPTHTMQAFMTGIPSDALKGIDLIVFDTRLTAGWVKIFGYAAGKIADGLKIKGGRLIASPAGFFVTGNKGPLKYGEKERAATWIKTILANKK